MSARPIIGFLTIVGAAVAASACSRGDKPKKEDKSKTKSTVYFGAKGSGDIYFETQIPKTDLPSPLNGVLPISIRLRRNPVIGTTDEPSAPVTVEITSSDRNDTVIKDVKGGYGIGRTPPSAEEIKDFVVALDCDRPSSAIPRCEVSAYLIYYQDEHFVLQNVFVQNVYGMKIFIRNTMRDGVGGSPFYLSTSCQWDLIFFDHDIHKPLTFQRPTPISTQVRQGVAVPQLILTDAKGNKTEISRDLPCAMPMPTGGEADPQE